ncbi:MAG: carbohydrate ABC transporter permease [Alsobacter sp.]
MTPPAALRRAVFRVLVVALLAAFVLLPLAQALVVSLTATIAREGLPEGAFTLANYRAIATTPVLRDSVLNSLAYVLLNVALCLLAGLPAAYAFARYRFLGDRHVFLMLLAFRITPPVVLSLPLFIVFAQAGLVNSPVGIALVHCLFNLPVTIWILESFIAAVPREFDETAFLDGYSLPRFFVRHLVPAIAPGIGIAAFFAFVFSWVEVVLARILTVTAGKPITMAINALFGFRTDWGLVMAMTIVSLVPGVAMLWFVRHHIAKGFIIRA